MWPNSPLIEGGIDGLQRAVAEGEHRTFVAAARVVPPFDIGSAALPASDAPWLAQSLTHFGGGHSFEFVRALLNGYLLTRTPLGFLTQLDHFARRENEKHEQRDDSGGDPENAEIDFHAHCFMRLFYPAKIIS
jgi:hypothetical protein